MTCKTVLFFQNVVKKHPQLSISTFIATISPVDLEFVEVEQFSFNLYVVSWHYWSDKWNLFMEYFTMTTDCVILRLLTDSWKLQTNYPNIEINQLIQFVIGLLVLLPPQKSNEQWLNFSYQFIQIDRHLSSIRMNGFSEPLKNVRFLWMIFYEFQRSLNLTVFHTRTYTFLTEPKSFWLKKSLNSNACSNQNHWMNITLQMQWLVSHQIYRSDWPA